MGVQTRTVSGTFKEEGGASKDGEFLAPGYPVITNGRPCSTSEGKGTPEDAALDAHVYGSTVSYLAAPSSTRRDSVHHPVSYTRHRSCFSPLLFVDREANLCAGWVYIISNLDAFGAQMVKIGMTRRLDPMHRVPELGDASVPFRFDVHALTFSYDAVGLESNLHAAFADQRVNRVTKHREFSTPSPPRSATS